VRSMRPALTSKTQASATTSGKPSASATTTYESTASGQCSPCITGSMICSTANAAMPYPTIARKTRRRFNSARRGSDTAPKRYHLLHRAAAPRWSHGEPLLMVRRTSVLRRLTQQSWRAALEAAVCVEAICIAAFGNILNRLHLVAHAGVRLRGRSRLFACRGQVLGACRTLTECQCFRYVWGKRCVR